jgi:Na+-transporting methylmalonyl-CoA/oxaloacetate decarboxylase gamma subunit
MTKIKTGLGLLLLSCLLAAGIQAQQVTSLRLNEVLVVNEDNFVDDYGKRNAWIEIYNSSAGTVNLAGCFLTNDRNTPMMYPVPKGDVLTRIPPRQHALFWADGQASKGTFHVSFTLDAESENYIALYGPDGRTLIDEIVVPAVQQTDISFGRLIDGRGDWAQLPRVTPSTNNLTLDKNEKIDNFKINDSMGLGLTASSMLVVFLGLIFLFLVFKFIGKRAIAASKKRAQASHGGDGTATATVAASTSAEGELSGEVLAAITMALFEFDEAPHDDENTVLTIEKVKRNYSPWSSKIYTLREVPRVTRVSRKK